LKKKGKRKQSGKESGIVVRWEKKGREKGKREGRLTLVVFPLVDILKVVDPRIVVILPREHEVIDVAGMGVRNGMTCLVSMIPLSQGQHGLLFVSHLPKPVIVSMGCRSIGRKTYTYLDHP
jgi:hypothetical protein